MKSNTAPFEILRHSTDAHNLPVVDIQGVYLSNANAIKLRDELNQLLAEPQPPSQPAVTITFENVEDLLQFTRYVVKCKEQDGTPGNLYVGLMSSALKRAKVNPAFQSQPQG